MTDGFTDQEEVVEAGAEPDRTTGNRPTRWEKVVGAVGLVVLLIVATQMVSAATGSGGFEHGPSGDQPAERDGSDDEDNPHGGSGWDH